MRRPVQPRVLYAPADLDNYTVKGELKEPFAILLGDDLRRIASTHTDEELQRAVIDQEAQELTDAIRQAQRQRDRED